MHRLRRVLIASCAGLLGSGLATPYAQASPGNVDRPTALTFQYTGNSCAAWINHQDTSASCSDHAFLRASRVRIVAGGTASGDYLWYEGSVDHNGSFTVDALNAERLTFTGTIVFSIFDPQGTLLQTIRIGTDDQPSLVAGDVYGGLTLNKVQYKFKIPPSREMSQYVISFDDDVSWREIKAYADHWAVYGTSVVMDLPLINGLAMKVPDYVRPEELAADPRVVAVELNRRLAGGELLDSDATSFIRPLGYTPAQGDYPWSIVKLYEQPYDYSSTTAPLATLDAAAIPDTVQSALQLVAQAGTRIAFFDTGIYDHKEISQKIKGGVDVVNGTLKEGRYVYPLVKFRDDNGHGTHVAGIAAALLDRYYDWGSGSGQQLYSVKVLDKYATGSLSNIVMGLQWAIYNDIQIVNMSLGYHQDSPAARRAVAEAAKAGLIMVASVGNHSNYDDSVVLNGAAEGGAAEGGAAEGGAAEGGAAEGGAAEGGAAEGGAGAYDDSGDALPLYSVMYPARYPEVIAVGASAPSGSLAAFSNSGGEMDITAPGVDILSLDITNGKAREGFGSTSGTSMAAPYVTAAVAMMRALDPTLGALQIRDILRKTAGHAGKKKAAGDLNLVGALKEVMNRSGKIDAADLVRLRAETSHKEKLKQKIRSVGYALWQ